MRFKNVAVVATLALGLAALALVMFSVPAGPIWAQAGEGARQQPAADAETVILRDAAVLAGIQVPDSSSKPSVPAGAEPALDFLSSLQKEGLSLDPGPLPSRLQSVTADAIVNGDFESGPGVAWLEYSTNGWPLILPDESLLTPPRSGSWAVWLGGAYTETSIIQQTVVVPTQDAILGYWVWTASQDYCGYDYGGVLVWTDSSTYYVVDVFNLCEAENTGQWVKREVDLSFFASQVVDLQVRAECDGSLNSNLFVDDVRLGLPEIGDHRVFLPIVQRLAGGGPEPFAPACSASNSYCEPYNTWSTAYGRLQPNVEYRAYPNDSNDYYYFTIDHTTSLTVRVTSYNATGQVLGAVGVAGGPSDKDEICALAGIEAIGFH